MIYIEARYLCIHIFVNFPPLSLPSRYLRTNFESESMITTQIYSCAKFEGNPIQGLGNSVVFELGSFHDETKVVCFDDEYEVISPKNILEGDYRYCSGCFLRCNWYTRIAAGCACNARAAHMHIGRLAAMRTCWHLVLRRILSKDARNTLPFAHRTRSFDVVAVVTLPLPLLLLLPQPHSYMFRGL